MSSSRTSAPPRVAEPVDDSLDDDSLAIGGKAALTGLVVMFFTWGSWWIVIGIVLLLVGVHNLVIGARQAWRRLSRPGPG